MYKKYTANDYRKFFSLPDDYTVKGFIVYGTFHPFVYEQFEKSLAQSSVDFKELELRSSFFDSLKAYEVGGETYWVATAYGSALLSEYLHLACLFGSKKNILLGSCGGLKKGIASTDLIIPTWSYAEESSAKAYMPSGDNKFLADTDLGDKLEAKLKEKYTAHRGPTVTYQAMMAETWEDITRWSEQGFMGVEMEASTVFAVSRHFEVPAAAILRIGDNLIEEETVMSPNYESSKDVRRQTSQDIFDAAVEEILTQ